MCRNIRTLYNFEPAATSEEIQLASLQYVRKVTGFHHPSKANEAVFLAAVEQVASATGSLLAALKTTAQPKNREAAAARLRARAAQRFSRLTDRPVG
jgi:hypothetical protein